MANLGDFDANQVDPAKDFEALPPGRYPAMITDSEEVDNSSGEGSHLKLTFQVLDGPYKNRMLWHRLNLNHKNPALREIFNNKDFRIAKWDVVKADGTQAHAGNDSNVPVNGQYAHRYIFMIVCDS